MKTRIPPETVEKIGALSKSGLSGRQISAELSLPVSTVAQIVTRLGLAKPQNYRQGKPTKKPEPRLNAKAMPDYRSALYVKAPTFAPPKDIVRNSLMTAPYVPRELDYRGRR